MFRHNDMKQDAIDSAGTGSVITTPFSHHDYLQTSKIKLLSKPTITRPPVLLSTQDLIQKTNTTTNACVGIANMTGRNTTDHTNANVTERHVPIIVEINKDLLNDFTGYVDYTQVNTYGTGSGRKSAFKDTAHGGTRDNRQGDSDLQPAIKKFALFDNHKDSLKRPPDSLINGGGPEPGEPSSAMLPSAGKSGINPLYVKDFSPETKDEMRKAVAVPVAGPSLT